MVRKAPLQPATTENCHPSKFKIQDVHYCRITQKLKDRSRKVSLQPVPTEIIRDLIHRIIAAGQHRNSMTGLGRLHCRWQPQKIVIHQSSRSRMFITARAIEIFLNLFHLFITAGSHRNFQSVFPAFPFISGVSFLFIEISLL